MTNSKEDVATYVEQLDLDQALTALDFIIQLLNEDVE
jgi:hypothetical protein